ncbi:MAG: HIT family protein [Kiritimatiellaeota bacterium]|nr:HIT family protein [Kiritimatiellota bacterium]
MSAECIFCRIAAGALPAVKIYEDADTLAFLDIGPIVKGHALVIPRQHYDPITQTPEPVLARLMAVVKKIAQAQMNGLRADGVNVIQANGAAAGQMVPHLHFHVIPRYRADGHHWNWAAKKYEQPEEMQRLAAAIQAAL